MNGCEFRAAAERVRRRWFHACWVRLLARSAPWVFALTGAALIALRAAGRRADDIVWAVPLVAAWLGGAALLAWVRRPRPTAALALWDERAGRGEAFVSAFCFETLPHPGPGELLHLEASRGRLAAELPRLAEHLPAPLRPHAVILPAVFLALVLSGWPRTPLAAEDAPLDDEARARAREVAAQLAEEQKNLDRLAGLTPEEKKKAEEVRRAVAEGAEKMRKIEASTPRDILEELEKLARQAEKLADEMGAGATDDELLSAAMLAELERHADTADLAGALRAKDAEKIAREADKIAERLRRDDATREERGRMRDALAQALAAATPQDKKGLVGGKMDEAHADLQAEKPKDAADKFSEIAKRFAKEAQRRNAQRRLQELARSLRGAGLKVLARSQRQLQRLERTPPAGPMPPGSPYVNPGSILPGGRPVSGSRSVINSGNPQGARPGTGNAPVPGGGPQGQGQGPAPIPGTGQGQGQGQGQGPGNCPVPGAGAGKGGLQAGRGSTALGKNPTKPTAAGRSEVVNAPPSGPGESEVRAVEGPQHEEEAARDARAIELEALRAEEDALPEEGLPLSRREQVLRYFTELRRQLEK